MRLTSGGIRLDGPWGEGMPLRDLADGIKSSFLWITDLIGWALTFRPKRRSTEGIRGIVLVDELEQHLHARWQRTIVHDLRQILPNVQFIVSTHSPLIAASVGPRIERESIDRIYVLESEDDDGVKASAHPAMRGWSIDQVLASRAFKYQIETDPETEDLLRAASALGDASQRTPSEELLFEQIKEILKHAFLDGVSPIERLAAIDADQHIRKRLGELSANKRSDKEEG